MSVNFFKPDNADFNKGVLINLSKIIHIYESELDGDNGKYFELNFCSIAGYPNITVGYPTKAALKTDLDKILEISKNNQSL